MKLPKIIFALLHKLCFLIFFCIVHPVLASDALLPGNLLSTLQNNEFALNQDVFAVKTYLKDNKVDIVITIKDKAYIYKDSLKLAVSDNGEAFFTYMPETVVYTDFQGTHDVFFNELKLEAIITKSKANSIL